MTFAHFARAVAAAALLAAAAQAAAQDYPTRPVRMIVGFAAGGGTDTTARTIAALAINPSLYTNLPFDPERDLAPVTQAVDSTNILSLHPSVPAGSVKELIALAKSKSLNYGSSGVGATGHLAGELFNLMTGVKLVHVP